MSRLTKYFADRDEYGHNSCHGGCESCTGVLCGDAFEMIKKLAHYEDLEEQGRLVEQKHGQCKPTGNIEVLYAKEYACSVCGGIMLGKSEFCPDCGAKMEELKGTEE